MGRLKEAITRKIREARIREARLKTYEQEVAAGKHLDDFPLRKPFVDIYYGHSRVFTTPLTEIRVPQGYVVVRRKTAIVDTTGNVRLISHPPRKEKVEDVY